MPVNQPWQWSRVPNITRALVVQVGEIQTERSKPDRLFIEVDPKDPIHENSQPLGCQPSPPGGHFVAHYPPKRLNKEDARPTRRIAYAWVPVQHLRSESMGKHELHEFGRCVVSSGVVIGACAVELLIHRADEAGWHNTEVIGPEEETALRL
jgi:hypothetical protein